MTESMAVPSRRAVGARGLAGSAHLWHCMQMAQQWVPAGPQHKVDWAGPW